MTYQEQDPAQETQLTPRGRVVVVVGGVAVWGAMAAVLGSGAKTAIEELHDAWTVDSSAVELVVVPKPTGEEGGLQGMVDAHIQGRLSTKAMLAVDKYELGQAVVKVISKETDKSSRQISGTDIATVYIEEDGDVHPGQYIGQEPYVIDGKDVKFAEIRDTSVESSADSA